VCAAGARPSSAVLVHDADDVGGVNGNDVDAVELTPTAVMQNDVDVDDARSGLV